MRFYVLLLLVSAASYAVAACAASAVVRLVWGLWQRGGSRRFTAEQAPVLTALRFLPVAGGCAALLIFTGVFVRFEPRGTTEEVGWTLGGTAMLAVVFAGAALVRSVRSLRTTMECRRLVRTCGYRWNRPDRLPVWLVDTHHPVAAVAGVFRPQMLISTRILEECPPPEAEAILRHEAAHLRRRDNLVRALMLALPDPLALTRAGRDLEHAWSAAAEQGADEEAAGSDITRRTDLASALLRVARMAEGTPAVPMPGMAFYEGVDLDARVTRLLASPPPRRPGRGVPLAGALLLVVIAVAAVLSDPLARPLHQGIESVVAHLP